MPKAPVLPPAEVVQGLEAIGAAVRRARLARGDTQERAAERLGVHVQTIRRIEEGQPEVAVGHVFGLLSIYGRGRELFALAEDDEQTRILMSRQLPKQGRRRRTSE